MTGTELRAIRKALGLSVVQMGRAFGWQGKDNSVSVQVRKYEGETRPIPITIERLSFMFRDHGVPPEWLR